MANVLCPKLNVEFSSVCFITMLHNLIDVTYILLCVKYHIIRVNISKKSIK